MPPESPVNPPRQPDPRKLWLDQPHEEKLDMSLTDIRARAGVFQSRIARRNLIEYIAAAFVIGVFGWMAWLIPEMVVKAGAVLIALGALVVCWNLHRQARAASASELAAAASNWVDFHRAELIRQRDALRSVWSWYLGPFAPGLAVFLLGVYTAPSTNLPLAASFVMIAVSLAIVASVFLAIAWLNARAADAIQKQIDTFDTGR